MPIDLEPDPYLLAVNDPTKLYLAHLGTMFLIVCIYIELYIYIHGICMVYIWYGAKIKSHKCHPDGQWTAHSYHPRDNHCGSTCIYTMYFDHCTYQVDLKIP